MCTHHVEPEADTALASWDLVYVCNADVLSLRQSGQEGASRLAGRTVAATQTSRDSRVDLPEGDIVQLVTAASRTQLVGRTVLNLTHAHALPRQAAARCTGADEGAVKSYLHRR